jgi:hypothetical protein
MFECERDAVADAARMGDLDGLADMKGQVGRRNVAEPEFARVQCDRHIAREESDDFHVASVIAARDQVVLGLNQIECDHLRLRADQRGRDSGLQEHVVGGGVAQDLRDVAERDPAARSRRLLVAAEFAF